MSRYKIYGIPAQDADRGFNPLRDVFICEPKDEGFARTICRVMAKEFPGERYYVWDVETTNVIYAYRVNHNEIFS
jgi:hypothetical protein